MKTLAIIGPTASGKSDLALDIAERFDCNILSIDSLSIYREIDIASAKPSAEELARVQHFGINHLNPDEHFSVSVFLQCYEDACRQSEAQGKDLVIVGGTGFYLKTLITGLSPIPDIEEATRQKAAGMMHNREEVYTMLQGVDPEYMKQIESSDSYRIEKMLLLYLQTEQTPSAWFASHPPVPIIEQLPILEIDIDREILRERIALRTDKMIQMGLIDEVAMLEARYGRSPNSMKAIGIIEVLDYLDGECTFEQMRSDIITHTAQLAKRQQTFNRNQFPKRISGSIKELHTEACRLLQQS